MRRTYLSVLTILLMAMVGLSMVGLALLSPAVAWAQEEDPDPIIVDELVIEEQPAAQAEVEGEQAEVAGSEVEVPAVSMRTIEPGLKEAYQLLKNNFEHFLDRQPLGFDGELITLVSEDGQNLWSSAEELVRDPRKIDPWAILGLIIALIVIALFAIVFLVIERQASRWAHRFQARIHFDSSAWLTGAVRKAIIVLGRSIAVPILIIFSFFPVRAILGAQPWTLLLTDALILFLIYRTIKTALATTLRLNPRGPDSQEYYPRLEFFGLLVLRVTLGFVLVLAAFDRFEFHEQASALVSFSFRLTLALLPIYLFFIRDAVLSLFPKQGASSFYKILRQGLASKYPGLVGLTIVLLLFNAAGYVDAATYLLTRGYALIIVGSIWFALLERLHNLVKRRIKEAEEADESPSPLLEALEHWIVALGTLIMAVIALRLMGIYEPLIAVLKVPFLAVGRVEISLFNLLNVALIIVATILSIRLFKAVLNAKVYPALNIEIGVAYAFNTLINYALVVISFILCLVALGVHLSAVMVVMASLGVGIGFGLQNIAENLISGFILLFGRAVKKGDYITVNELYGRVEAVGARSVVVRTPDNFSMLIPSKEIVSGRIINWTFQDSIVRIHIPIGVSYSSDPEEVKEILLHAAKHHPDILTNPAPDVWISDFGDNSIKFELLVYFDCRSTNERTLKGKFNFILWKALQEGNVGIPFPQRDLHIRTVDDKVIMPQSWGRPAAKGLPEEKDSTGEKAKPRRQSSAET